MVPTYYCYLLLSLDKHKPSRTYVGFTTDPKRRVRQHRGIIKGGAKATRCRKKWVVSALVKGFPTKTNALHFEHMWKEKARGWGPRIKKMKELVQAYPQWNLKTLILYKKEHS